MIQTQSRIIDGLTVEISQLPGMKALRMSARLGKIFGTPLAKALSTIDIANIEKTDVTVIGASLVSIFEGLTEDELEAITKTLLAASTVEGKPMFPGVFDLEFAGKIDTVYKVLAFALEVNYGSFFGVLRALGVHAKVVKGLPSSSPLTAK